MRMHISLSTLLLVAAMVTIAMATPAVAAKPDGMTKTGDGGYYVLPAVSGHGEMAGGMWALSSSGTITQGEYRWHSRLVNYYTQTLNYNLYWGNTANSLRLRVFTPDGYVLGPFYDSSDGQINGRINIDIYRSGGVAQGTWYSEVYGHQVTGVQSYTI
jgi:hypothetical protein